MIKQFILNLMLTFVWVAITGNLSFVNFFFGYGIGYGVLWLIERKAVDRKYFTRVPKIIGFFFYFIYDMLKANFKIAYDVLTPKYFMRPGIVAFPLAAKTPFEITMLSNVISLTPGTLIIDVSEDQSILYIHVMYLKDPKEFIHNMHNGIEKRLLEILR